MVSLTSINGGGEDSLFIPKTLICQQVGLALITIKASSAALLSIAPPCGV